MKRENENISNEFCQGLIKIDSTSSCFEKALASETVFVDFERFVKTQFYSSFSSTKTAFYQTQANAFIHPDSYRDCQGLQRHGMQCFALRCLGEELTGGKPRSQTSVAKHKWSKAKSPAPTSASKKYFLDQKHLRFVGGQPNVFIYFIQRPLLRKAAPTDAMGNRIAKHIYNNNGTWAKSTYYVRDAQGNVLATYDKDTVSAALSYKLKERDMYGSSRVGLNTTEIEMIDHAAFDTVNFTHTLGKKQFEIANHLGNVLEVITDRKFPKDLGDYDSNNDGVNESYVSGTLDNVVDQYNADILLSRDYTPFGVVMDGRKFDKQTCDTIVIKDTTQLFYDQFASGTGGYQKLSGTNTLTNSSGKLQCAGSNTMGTYKPSLTLNIGDYYLTYDFDKGTLTAGEYIVVRLKNTGTSTTYYTSAHISTTGSYSETISNVPSGTYQIEFERLGGTANHAFKIDNVKLKYIVTTTQIDCDGKGDYVYSFQSQMHDDEMYGEGNSINFEFRMHNPRLGVFHTPDPLAASYEYNSPYAFAENKLGLGVELEGKELKYFNPLYWLGEYNNWVFGSIGLEDSWLASFNKALIKKLDGEEIEENIKAQIQQIVNDPFGYVVSKFLEADPVTGNILRSNESLKIVAKASGGDPDAVADLAIMLLLLKESKAITSSSIITKSAEEVNTAFTANNKYAPYKAGTIVEEYALGKSEKFIRLSNSAKGNVKGDWIVKESDIKDLSPQQIKDKYSLSYTPDMISDVSVGAGSKLRKGTAAGVGKLGTKGGGTQYEILEHKNVEYTNTRELK